MSCAGNRYSKKILQIRAEICTHAHTQRKRKTKKHLFRILRVNEFLASIQQSNKLKKSSSVSVNSQRSGFWEGCV